MIDTDAPQDKREFINFDFPNVNIEWYTNKNYALF